MIIVIDHFEENFAVVELENKNVINIPREIIPLNAKEGDVISISVDVEQTNKRKDDINKLMRNLWED